MTTVSNPLSLERLRLANVMRCPKFGHDVQDWTPQLWGLAMAGEVGELCNLLKKQVRGDEIREEDILDEIADVVIYADLLCARLGANLGDVVRCKFNDVPRRVGSDILL